MTLADILVTRERDPAADNHLAEWFLDFRHSFALSADIHQFAPVLRTFCHGGIVDETELRQKGCATAMEAAAALKAAITAHIPVDSTATLWVRVAPEVRRNDLGWSGYARLGVTPGFAAR